MTGLPAAPESRPREMPRSSRPPDAGSSLRCSGGVDAVIAADVMIASPKVLPADASVGDVRSLFDDDHVVMVLLAEDGVLLGTLLRSDLPDTVPASAPARPLSTTTGRTVSPAAPVAAVYRRLLEQGARRLVVVDGANRLLGLVCLKRSRTGFCTDAGVAARSRAVQMSGVRPENRKEPPPTARRQ